MKISSQKEASGTEFNLFRSSIFGAAYKQLGRVNPTQLRPRRPLGAEAFITFEVQFRGENVAGQAGPYRQFFNDVSSELVQSNTPLFLPCPNAQSGVGDAKDMVLPKPSNSSKAMLSLYEFVGVLMGCCIRTGVRLNLGLPPLFWKQLVGDEPTEADLEAIDSSISSLRVIRTIDRSLFADSFFEKMTTRLSDKTEVELVPGGSDIDVTAENREEYVSLVLQRRLHEGKEQIDAIRNGIYKVVSKACLQFCSWKDLELWITGKPDIDIELLKV